MADLTEDQLKAIDKYLDDMEEAQKRAGRRKN